jgi:hypothetical protein
MPFIFMLELHVPVSTLCAYVHFLLIMKWEDECFGTVNLILLLLIVLKRLYN